MTVHAKLDVAAFNRILVDEVRAIGTEQHWDIAKEVHRGYAFQLWFGRVLCQADQGLDTEPEEAMLKSRDLKADLVFEDQTRQHLYIVQCKYMGAAKRKKPMTDEAEIRTFFQRHDKYADRSWVKQHGSDAVFELLGDYGEKLESGWNVDYYFVSTGRTPDVAVGLEDEFNQKYVERGLDHIRCTFLDFSALRDFYVRAQSLEHSVPDEVTLDIPEGKFFEKMGPRKTLVAVLKGNALRDLYKRFRESLFAWNIRTYLGNRGINREMTETADEDAEDFFYFNNGVSAVCTGYHLTGNTLCAQRFQIINGAQTVGALYRSKPGLTEVLFRLTVTPRVTTYSGINERIIRFNNTQNAIRLSDFRANDSIQDWLVHQFAQVKHMSSLPAIDYRPKRSGKRRTGHGLSLEDLARIRYSFLYEPMTVHASVKDLWTQGSDGGLYGKSFGDGEKVPPVWTKEQFNESLLAVALYLKLDAVTKEERKTGRPYLRRLRYHALSLFREYLAAKGHLDKTRPLLKDPDRFGEVWQEGWRVIRTVLLQTYNIFVNPETADKSVISTMHSFVRNGARYNLMRANVTDAIIA